ncbi:MAG: hypothetical protein A2Y97_06430 [Nitrospirae bacterium RBG_13_39_12]|nr:MAG: hypothetical protein A2Y97_06430 [Nitrospirae bacterium RBG_13_39_12]
MTDKNSITEKLADPKSFRKAMNTIQRKLRNAKTRKEKRELTMEWEDLGEMLAWELLEHGEYKKALVIYKKLPWRRHGENKYLGIGRALMEIGHHREAKRFLEKGLKRFPESIYLLYGMGIFYDGLKIYSLSLKYYDQALKHSPNNEFILLRKGTALFALGCYEDASLMYQRISEKFPEEPNLLIMIGNCYLLTGYPEEASVYFKKGIGLEYPGSEALEGLYFSYRDMNLYTDALEIAQECFRKYHNDPNSYLILVDACWIQGWTNEAKKTLIEGIERFPDDERLKDLLKEIEDKMDNPDDDKKFPLLPVLICLQILRRKLERRT